MHRVFRVLLVWVMAIAIPVQGMAAAAMLSCGPSHARMMQGLLHGTQQAAGPAHTAHQAHQAHGPSTAPHGDHHGHAVPGDAGHQAHASAGAAADGAGPQPDLFSCSACAACCAMLALPAAIVLPDAVAPVQPLRAALVVPLASQPPDGLDRPPRAALG